MDIGRIVGLIKALGGGGSGSSLPSVTPSDNGKVLTVKDGAWAAQQKKFIVTLTPTSPYFSGTMDKTVSQIKDAYDAGMEIVFRIMMSATDYMDVDCTARYVDEYAYPSFNAFIVNSINDALIFAYTGTGDDGTQQTYYTKVYSLTPAS